jgi:hypothetical protein
VFIERLNSYFIHINKTGGISICAALGVKTDHPNPTLARTHATDPEWSSRFSFAFVRNPWDKEVSNFLWHSRRPGMPTHDLGLDFPGYLRYYNRGCNPIKFWNSNQLHWITYQKKIAVSFVGRFERLEEDFAEACRRMGIVAALPHHNVSVGRTHYRDYYDSTCRRIVGYAYDRDVKTFGYEF